VITPVEKRTEDTRRREERERQRDREIEDREGRERQKTKNNSSKPKRERFHEEALGCPTEKKKKVGSQRLYFLFISYLLCTLYYTHTADTRMYTIYTSLFTFLLLFNLGTRKDPWFSTMFPWLPVLYIRSFLFSRDVFRSIPIFS
jgi:hypothetical protein